MCVGSEILKSRAVGCGCGIGKSERNIDVEPSRINQSVGGKFQEVRSLSER